jgi:hypothetical protein
VSCALEVQGVHLKTQLKFHFIILQYIIIIIIWLYSPNRVLPPLWGFVTVTFLRGWIVSPAPNPQPGGPGLRIYDPRRQGGPAIPPGTGYPF